MLYEISRKVININKYDGTTLLWNKSVLTVRGHKELHLLEYSFNLNCLEKKIDFKESTICSSNKSPLPQDYLTKYVSHGVKNLELVEMVINSAFWPHNNLLMQEMKSITAFDWAPLHNDNYGLLATLNSVGNIEFFRAAKHTWCSVLDFSSEMKEHLGNDFKKLIKHPKNFSEVKETVYSLETAAICWAPNLNEDNSCYFVTAQKSGVIYFWSIKNDSNVETQFSGSIQSTNYDEIVCMIWIPITKKNILLIFSNERGEIISIECRIKEGKVVFKEIHNIWAFKDKMVVTHIHYHLEGDKLLLFFNKHRHLVIQMYDKNLKLLSQLVENVNDYKITSLTRHKNEFYLTTINTKIYRINYTIVDNKLNATLNSIDMKDPCHNYDLFGLAISTNGALFALALISRKLLHRKESINIEIVLYSTEIGFDTDFSCIINNPSKSLTNMWDIIEVLRCKILKSKKLPEFDYSVLLKGNDIYNLKVYLVILTFYNNLEKSMTRGLKGLLPETSIDAIKERLFLLQACNMIHNLYNKLQNNSPINDFNRESFEGSKKYLYYYCKKYNKSVKDFITDDILNISNDDFTYVCQCCDKNILDLMFTCTNKHYNMICSHTFAPIDGDYLVCKSCNSTARIELLSQNPTCIFCDLFLRNS